MCAALLFGIVQCLLKNGQKLSARSIRKFSAPSSSKTCWGHQLGLALHA